jgi:hypothetical protein
MMLLKHDKRTADLLGAIKELLAMPDYSDSNERPLADIIRIRRVAVSRARRLVEQYEEEPCQGGRDASPL